MRSPNGEKNAPGDGKTRGSDPEEIPDADPAVVHLSGMARRRSQRLKELREDIETALELIEEQKDRVQLPYEFQGLLTPILFNIVFHEVRVIRLIPDYGARRGDLPLNEL